MHAVRDQALGVGQQADHDLRQRQDEIDPDADPGDALGRAVAFGSRVRSGKGGKVV